MFISNCENIIIHRIQNTRKLKKQIATCTYILKLSFQSGRVQTISPACDFKTVCEYFARRPLPRKYLRSCPPPTHTHTTPHYDTALLVIVSRTAPPCTYPRIIIIRVTRTLQLGRPYENGRRRRNPSVSGRAALISDISDINYHAVHNNIIIRCARGVMITRTRIAIVYRDLFAFI